MPPLTFSGGVLGSFLGTNLSDKDPGSGCLSDWDPKARGQWVED